MKILKWIVGVLVVLGLLFFFVGMPYLRQQTKKHSPEKTAVYNKNNLDLSVTYSSPFKKGRVIFGELVPYDVVWRTGANEPTTFTTTTEIKIIDKPLPAGTYSLWTKPNREQWLIIFNEDIPDWGVSISSGGRETTREPGSDVVQVEVPVSSLTTAEESFTIAFEEDSQLYLSLFWDTTKVSVPINP
ncbi:DUF2911 domain-containing protein [Poritiphilus flavus]|uniref:DUF2911 domain-containing protein n=1 Tax=Poritiphilus flavus TaxID=2697053 RepID=A0A6L9E9R3_9FLAO|nr:DUF2911 domain-containing protein [Poritiphilus flavus]NAS11302.1 DUF2911 domain-containing protein [Poritiphilus flavus]